LENKGSLMEKRGSHFKKWVTFAKIGLTYKSGSQLEKWAALGKTGVF